MGRITEIAVLKFNEANKIRELYRAIGEITETENKGMRTKGDRKKKNEKQWGFFEVISANQTDRLGAPRSKMKSKILIYHV